MKTDAAVAKLLFDVGAIAVRPDDPFRAASGLATPMYTDCRVLLSYPSERKRVGAALEKLCRANFPDADVVAGMATSGMPWASWLAASLNKPMVYVRTRPHRQGKMARIEGVLEPGSSVVIVDDVINTGGGLVGGATAIRTAGGDPVGALAVSTYQLKTAVEAFRKARIPLFALTNLRSLLTVGRTNGHISPESERTILDWASHPASWTGPRDPDA